MIATLLVVLLALPSDAAPKPADSRLSRLFSRVSAYLNAEPVRKAKVTAVAAVRGGIPTDQGENLDQRLLDRAYLLRARLLAGGPSADEKALRGIYRALAASQWIQALEKNSRAELAGEVSRSLKGWLKAPGSPSEAALKALLSGPTQGLDDKALVAAGWGAYCRALTPELKGAAPPSAGRASAAQTARLDEMLKSLQESWTSKVLPDQEVAEAHFLAGQVYETLAGADYAGVELARPAASAPASPAAPEPPRKAQAAPAPEADASPAPEFVPKKIYGKAAKAVVLILCASPEGSGELGSGSLLDASGRVLTNSHVVIRDSTGKPWPTIRVYLKPAKMTGDPKQDLRDPIEAKVLSWEPGLDLALIQLSRAPEGAETLSLADPESVDVGDRVAAIGHPEQGGLWTLTTGVVSTHMADLGGVKGKNAFQTDASINRGNSGGPLLNAHGDIIGVNTLMSRKAADGLAITAVNFAVKADVAKRWLASAGTVVAYAAAPPATVAASAPSARRPVEAIAASAAAPKPKRETITESRPYDREKLIEEEIKEMDEMGDEMHQEILRKTQPPR